MQENELVKPPAMGDNQWNYRKLELQHGQDEAKKIVADRLRELADIVESDEYPDVFGFEDDSAEVNKSGFNPPMRDFRLILTFPWGG